MALVVSGRIDHADMKPSEVQRALKARWPGLIASEYDFSLQRNRCQVNFFCNSSVTLDYTVELSGSASASATVTELIRESNAVNNVIETTLRKHGGKAKIAFCLLEDEKHRSSIMELDSAPRPLKSLPAKVSYGMAIILLALMVILLIWQLQQPSSDGRDFNLVTLAVGVGLPALTVPLPFVFEHFRRASTSRWVFAGTDGKVS